MRVWGARVPSLRVKCQLEILDGKVSTHPSQIQPRTPTHPTESTVYTTKRRPCNLPTRGRGDASHQGIGENVLDGMRRHEPTLPEKARECLA